VVLTIARKGQDRPWIVPLERTEIVVRSVKAAMVEPGYAWLRISQFQEQTVGDMAAKLTELYRQDPSIKGLVLDLRNDPGGLLPGAIGVSAAFLPANSEIVSTVGQLPDSNRAFYARREFYSGNTRTDPLAGLPRALQSVPMVVLVNGGSASAAEIVAGALQDYQRATIMGTQTFGKGSVQTLRQLSADTAVKLTTARYYTPKGRSIQARGITPDLRVEERVDGDGHNTMRVREADLDKHLSDGSGQAEPPERAMRQSDFGNPGQALDFGSKTDFQLAQALNHLKGLPVALARADTETLALPGAALAPEAPLMPPELDPGAAPAPGSTPKPAIDQ
jgi:carboxyl-terminal processing protease